MVRFDSSECLEFGQTQIKSPLTLTDDHGSRQWLEGSPVEVSGALARLVAATVEDVVVDEATGVLLIRFVDARRIRVQPDEEYEAWSLRRANGHLVVCGARGDLIVFDPVEPAAASAPAQRKLRYERG